VIAVRDRGVRALGAFDAVVVYTPDVDREGVGDGRAVPVPDPLVPLERHPPAAVHESAALRNEVADDPEEVGAGDRVGVEVRFERPAAEVADNQRVAFGEFLDRLREVGHSVRGVEVVYGHVGRLLERFEQWFVVPDLLVKRLERVRADEVLVRLGLVVADVQYVHRTGIPIGYN
jgi:hypothetical protein